MTQPTDITPAEIRSVSQAHLASKQVLDGQKQGVFDTVTMLSATSRGATMDTFKKFHELWDQDIQDINRILQEMADYLGQAANNLEQRDQAGA